MNAPTPSRRFCVRSAADQPLRAQEVDGESFEDAVLGYLDSHHPAADAEDGLSLFVEDLETGERQCFRIDLETGETAPCDEVSSR